MTVRLGNNHRLTPAPSSDFGPRDPRPEGEVFRCPCGVEYIAGGYMVAHDFRPCDRGGW